MKTYELTYIVSPELISEEAETKAKEIEALIKTGEGAVSRQNIPMARTLSYPIKKQASGYLGVLEFQLEPEKLNELEESLKKDEKIVRHMVVIKKPAKERRIRGLRKLPSVFGLKVTSEKTKEEPTPTVSRAEEEKTHSTDSGQADKKVELKDIEQKLDEILGE